MNRKHADEEYYFIIGADSLFTFEQWKEPGRICQNCKVVIAVRDHVPVNTLNEEIKRISEKYQGEFIRLDTLNIDISSAYIRDQISAGETIRYYVPAIVMEYIYQNQIYHVKEL